MSRALVEVYRHLELESQVNALAREAGRCTGLEVAVTFVPNGEGAALVGVSAARDAGERSALPELTRSKVRRLLGSSLQRTFDGPPPFLGDSVDPALRKVRASWVVAVLDTEDEVTGLLVLVGDSPPDESDRQRVLELIERAKPAIANGLRVRAIQELVIQDDTANCFNRRYFEEFLADELARASRFRSPLSLIFFDMDNLKAVNSSLGHAMGSRTLFEVSGRVGARIRKFDKLFRFGGDEFCIVLPETEWHGALEVAERVRESIAGKPLLLRETGGKGVRMTASFGISSYPLHAQTKEALIQRADRAMQRIKTGTKNSIAIAEIATPESS
jgi:diguanylate cyclase (GGDEF)-like protein